MPPRKEPIMPVLSIRPSVGAEEYPALAGIWRRAVDATHDFLAEEDRDEIEARLQSDYFPAVVLSVAERGGRPVGFSGVLDGALEMLFVDATQRNGGIGSALLIHAIREHGVTQVDVNEQNVTAAGFYARYGFEVVARSETDEAGRPYPLLHLRLSAPPSRAEAAHWWSRLGIVATTPTPYAREVRGGSADT
ncbi:acetyltransferase [Microbacterium sp. SORGH_AS_0888]|uniref:acetyltransferase n=1 Tax=Microbacterium sp. SORGH_AS_0888 TaxID=3041791 RepID=UPI00278A7264|nr:acetyltransferase [Microbacterium sp. SORGH_AS_0888]MDQ1128383.1 putative acetyltransferase [Microbacterium sp. SORGH_AS_0888]